MCFVFWVDYDYQAEGLATSNQQPVPDLTFAFHSTYGLPYITFVNPNLEVIKIEDYVIEKI